MTKRIAFFGGSFDPVHRGHIAVAGTLLREFDLDEFTFIPAFHAPHKIRKKPTSAYDRYAMLCLVTSDEPRITVSRMEIETPERPYSVETLGRLKEEFPGDEIFFVLGADSWADIATWREWQTVLTMSGHIVVPRPGSEIRVDHVTEAIRERIIDLRGGKLSEQQGHQGREHIYLTDAVSIDISATEIRRKIREQDGSWRDDVPPEVANYIEKYQIYS